MKKKRKGERLRSFHSPLKNLQHFSYLTSHFLVVKYRSAINYPPVSWEGREMHFPLDRSVACSADFDGAAELPVSKRESRLRWRLARRLSIASPHVSSAFVFPPPDFHQFLPDKFSSFGRKPKTPSQGWNAEGYDPWDGFVRMQMNHGDRSRGSRYRRDEVARSIISITVRTPVSLTIGQRWVS